MIYDQAAIQRALLFDEGDVVGYKYLSKGYPKEISTHQYFVINALKDLSCATLFNVACYRNFLVEMDTGTMEEQEHYIEQVLKMPFTTKVFSGKKSYHYIISLSEPLANKNEYDSVVRLLYGVVGIMDNSCGKSCNLSRTAGAVRVSTEGERGAVQRLVEARERVSQGELKDWLFKRPNLPPPALNGQPITRSIVTPGQAYLPLGKASKALIAGELPKGSRHEALKKLMVNMLHCGYQIEYVAFKLHEIAEKMGLERHDDVPNLIKWAMANGLG